jgi:hypothetical protein
MNMLSRRRSTARYLLAGMAGALIATTVHAQEGPFEIFEPRPTRAVVPADLIEGPHFCLAPTVQTFGYLNNFIMSSDYGTFNVQSDAMLRRLVREIHAIAVLQGITLTDAYADAPKQAALGPVRGVEDLAAQPVKSVEAVPTALFDVFARVDQGVDTTLSGDKSKYDDSAMAQALQMSSYKRDYAKQLGIDPYSSNQVLQKQLDSVAWAAAAGGLTVSVAAIGSGSATVAALSYARSLQQARDIVTAEPPTQLMIRNRAAPAAMEGTSGRVSVLQVALEAPDEVTAIFYREFAELLDGCGERVAHIISLRRFNRVIIALDANAKAVIVVPVDYMIWNERSAAAATDIAKTLQLQPGGDTFQLWITGVASPRFKKWAQALGIGVRNGVSTELPVLD